VTPVKRWFEWLFSEDRRQAKRHKSLPLVAYYWDGAEPVAHGILDASLTGMYLLTKQRWYPGTVVRVTLTDRDHPTGDRTLTVNAQAVRWGKDGVGLEFVLEKVDQQGTALTQTLERTLGLNPARVEAFLENLKRPPSEE